MSRPPNRGAEYLKWSDQIRRLAIRASGATPEPDAKIGPPSGLPKNFADRMAWNFLDDILWPAAHTAPFILGLGIPVLLVGLGIMRRRRRRHLLRHGQMAVGRVIEISQTGITVNQVPMMRLVVDVERAGEQPRRIKIRQLIDLGSMPRAGDRVYVLLDPKNPEKGTLAPSPSGAGIKVSGIPAKGGPSSEVDLNTDIARDVIALSPRLREHGKLGIAKLVSISPTTTTAKQLVLDIDTIGTPPRRVTTTQIIDGTPPLIGERVYILVDPDDPNIVALVPRSMTGGQSLPATANRLDPLVLGPEILRRGARAAGIVTSALEQPMANPALAAKGCSKWQLVIDVTPDDGSPPYQSTLVTAFSNREKTERIARVGAQVPLRYDPADRQTFAIDSIAMGYGDPYEAVRNLFRPG
jgi:hypothetical protein